MITAFEYRDGRFQALADRRILLLLIKLFEEISNLIDAPIVDPNLFAIMEDSFNETVNDETLVLVRSEPSDPALARLLPPMSADPETAAKLRALTEDDLRQKKTKKLVSVADYFRDLEGTNPRVVIPYGREWDWLTAINDVRIVLASRIQVDNAKANSDPQNFSEIGLPGRAPELKWWYSMLSWWQNSLLAAVESQRCSQ